MLKGRRKALVVSAVFTAFLLFLMILRGPSWEPDTFSITTIVNTISATMMMILLIDYFEFTRLEAVNAAQVKNDALEQANQALLESKDQLRLILDSTAEAIFGVDLEIRCTFCNASCLELLGYKTEEELIGKDMHALIHGKNKDGSLVERHNCKIIGTCMEGTLAHADDEVFWRKNGVCFDVDYCSYPQYKDGELIGAVVTFTDNTLKKLQEQQIEYYSSHDSLTGLLTRSCYEYLLKNLDNKNNLPISVIMGDLNGLKLMNDVFGHAAGDALLVKAAEILKKVCREEDIVARLGGDEFVILLPKTSYEQALLVTMRIRNVLGQEKTDVIKCSMSLGCDTKTSPVQSLDLTVKNAENEMYKEKTINRTKIDSDMINAIIMTLYRKSPYEEAHSTNVSELCRSIGEALQLPPTEIKQLRNAGFLHDIGKVGIHESILQRNGEFTELETAEYKQHPVIGYRILNLFDSTVTLAEWVYSHQENWDGSGYPRGLRGDEIPLMARIVTVAGRYDNLVSRENNTPEEALGRLQAEAGSVLDPDLVETFVRTMTKTV